MSLAKRKVKIKRSVVLLTLGIFFLLLIIYSFLIEPNSIKTQIVPISSDDLFMFFHDKKVVQISDLHITSIGNREKKLIKMLNQINPDILFITGDFLTNGEDEDTCIEVLQQIQRPPYGIWAVLGNSDRFMRNGLEYEGQNRFVKKLKNLGIKVLENTCESLVLEKNNTPLFIAGVEGAFLSRAKLDWLLRDIPSDSPIILLSHYPNILERQTDALVINLAEGKDIDVLGWKWQDNAFFEYDTGIIRFERNGLHKLRVQSRENGVSVEQICLVEESSEESFFDASSENSGKDLEGMYTTINPHSNEMIILKAKDIPDSNIFGSWNKVHDPGANFNPVIKDITDLGSRNERPLVKPKDYFDARFYAKANVDYHIWVRMKAEKNLLSHDSVYLQFSDTIDQKGKPVYRIGELGIRNKLERIDLILAGHTHGGQVRLPVIGILDIIHKHKITFDKGLFETQGTRMYVNRGVGSALIPVRFRCFPEISVFKFTKVEEASRE